MRSDLVFDAMTYVSNRFLLTKLASNAIRQLHRPNTRIPETANDVFVRFARANPMAGERRPQERAASQAAPDELKLIHSARPEQSGTLTSADWGHSSSTSEHGL